MKPLIAEFLKLESAQDRLHQLEACFPITNTTAATSPSASKNTAAATITPAIDSGALEDNTRSLRSAGADTEEYRDADDRGKILQQNQGLDEIQHDSPADLIQAEIAEVRQYHNCCHAWGNPCTYEVYTSVIDHPRVGQYSDGM